MREIEYIAVRKDDSELCHHGIKGMKWGVRRFQNKDGTRTPAGKKRYQSSDYDEPTINKMKKDGYITDIGGFTKKGHDREVERRKKLSRKDSELELKSIYDEMVSGDKNGNRPMRARRLSNEIIKYSGDISRDEGVSKAFKANVEKYDKLAKKNRDKLVREWTNNLDEKIPGIILKDLGYKNTKTGREYVKKLIDSGVGTLYPYEISKNKKVTEHYSSHDLARRGIVEIDKDGYTTLTDKGHALEVKRRKNLSEKSGTDELTKIIKDADKANSVTGDERRALLDPYVRLHKEISQYSGNGYFGDSVSKGFKKAYDKYNEKSKHFWKTNDEAISRAYDIASYELTNEQRRNILSKDPEYTKLQKELDKSRKEKSFEEERLLGAVLKDLGYHDNKTNRDLIRELVIYD